MERLPCWQTNTWDGALLVEEKLRGFGLPKNISSKMQTPMNIYSSSDSAEMKRSIENNILRKLQPSYLKCWKQWETKIL